MLHRLEKSCPCIFPTCQEMNLIVWSWYLAWWLLQSNYWSLSDFLPMPLSWPSMWGSDIHKEHGFNTEWRGARMVRRQQSMLKNNTGDSRMHPIAMAPGRTLYCSTWTSKMMDRASYSSILRILDLAAKNRKLHQSDSPMANVLPGMRHNGHSTFRNTPAGLGVPVDLVLVLYSTD